jgi:hypothetical protein
MAQVDGNVVLRASGSGPKWPKKIDTEWELKQATELIAEKKALKEYREKVQKMQYGNHCQQHEPELSMRSDMDSDFRERVLLPRWIMNWIDDGLKNRVDTIEKELVDEYGIEQ